MPKDASLEAKFFSDCVECFNLLLRAIENAIAIKAIPTKDDRTKKIVLNTQQISGNLNAIKLRVGDLSAKSDEICTLASEIRDTLCAYMAEGVSPNDSAKNGPVTTANTFIRLMCKHLNNFVGLIESENAEKEVV